MENGVSIEHLINQASSINQLCSLILIAKESTTTNGRTSYVVTAKGDEVETAFKLVEAGALIPSNTQDGRINPDFPQELQPRDRTRLSSQMQISKMAKGLRPQQLTDSGLSSHGAPIVGGDNVVESGNGRSMAIIKAYNEGKADNYRQYLIDNAERFNLDASKVKAMNAPVLVRERVTELDRAKFARDSNLSDLQQMSAAETAWVDAERIDDKLIALFQPSETGNLLARSNQGFVNSFLTEIGDNSTAGLLTEDGRPTKQLIERMQNAVFAKAYKNEKLVKLVSEEPDPEIRNVLNALNGAAAQFVEMQYLSGEAHKQTTSLLGDAIEIVNDEPSLAENALDSLVRATELIRQAKDSGQDIDELLAQAGLFGDNDPEAEALARFIATNNRSAKRMTEAFKAMAEEINSELLHQGQAMGDMFGGGQATLIDILGRVNQSLESNGQQTGFMFESMSNIDKQAHEAATSPLNSKSIPTQAQKKAGNYKKGNVTFCGLAIAIENPKGSQRTGIDESGNEWAIELKNHYGDIRGTTGADGDPVDVFLGDNDKATRAFIVNQTDENGDFDEHKVMLGFNNAGEAIHAYLDNYEEGWNNYSEIVDMNIFDFVWWLRAGDTTRPAAQ
ncbi:TPA: hypothetical protein NJ407_004073 [Vibrio parahaemolyticus]|nr:hypothetical protein [Vibrio parahaemolyticus]HCG7330461.1 hypothetical protein [Vibrio parahaemolyticus]HCG9589040.1 hypothetical protein [Vibrio parahaemolyticus]HCH1183476.1 hypothetical protein [Vibrio parahaemolyticus]HCM0851054.1 hypothetical protein [Vibrio parahaemolyticus]